MSDYRTWAAGCLAKAEKELRELLGRAAHDGDYSATLDLSRAALEVSRVAGSLAGTNGVKKEAGAAAVNSLSPVYPKFFREGDRLVLVGKQRKSAREYQHKCPKAVLDKLVAVLLSTSQNPQLPQVPGYPAYLPATCLRWLRRLGLVEKHGHKGYAVLDPEHFEESVAMHWQRLPAL